MQFYTEEGMTIAGVIVLVALAGYDGLTPRWLPPYIIGVAVILILYLLYRYLYVTRTVYVITSEQLKYECGVFSCSRDFIELYRVIDYSEQRSSSRCYWVLKQSAFIAEIEPTHVLTL